MIQAVLFDMDGVLVDTEDYICRAAMLFFEKEKNTKVEPQDFTPFVGAGENRYIGGVAEKYNIQLDIEKAKQRTYEIYGKLVKGNIQPLDGVHDFINKCKKKGLKIAVATSADKPKMEINLREIQLPESVFDATINGLEVENLKPEPEIFLKAANKLNVDPKKCLVVEDAVNGVKAAKKAGAKCLALTTSFSAKELNGADWISSTLADAPNECLAW